ncbi:tRNA ligase class I, partial [Oesophagostomum dentatum]
LAVDRPRFTFFDGPPFATGLPHYGHILAGTIKEYEVDKTLGIKGPNDILEMGIGKYNAECRSIVMRYSHEWETTVARMGRWIDFRNDYKTLYPWFMESVWWAFSELFKKGLVYRGVKVMPYSTSCSTPLSNFEAGQNYKDVVDPAVCIGFRLDENPNRMMVAWTTTPWTLPSNLALCVHPDLDYVVVKAEVTDFAGLYVKDADKQICKNLKERGLLIKQGEVKHSYPFCWRSDTPLLYKAVPSWFIRVEQIVPNLLANNEQTYWVPSFVKEKRFANWLRDARDWAVSRNRFWGTPINLWVSDDLEEVVCPGSIAELEQLTGTKITDLHRESVDHLTIPSKTGRGVLKRVTEVFDCWFESGSMPYAQNHYPFENKKSFEDNFPADFIGEGIDQTRGWFYTLLVLSTALFNKPPFKNLICNGLVLASDGNKMSKRKKNYPDPMEIVQKYGADALRLYLINSPVVRGENLRFREEGVRDLLKDVFLPWFNAYRFFVQNVQLYEHVSCHFPFLLTT